MLVAFNRFFYLFPGRFLCAVGKSPAVVGVVLEEIPAADERNAEHDERGCQAGNEEIGHECIAFNPCVERCERKENRQAAV